MPWSSAATRSGSSRRPSTCPTSRGIPILAALYHPPGGIIRHDAVVWGYARRAQELGVDIHQDTEVTGIDVADGRVDRRPDERRADHGRDRRQRHGRLGVDDRGHGRRPPADRDPSAAGAGHRAAQAVPRSGARVGDAARLRQPDRPRRAGHRRRRSTRTRPTATARRSPFMETSAAHVLELLPCVAGVACCASGPGSAT